MTDNRTTNLLPCPFCGGEASKRLFYKGKYRVHCNVCDAHSGDVCDTEAEAIEAWNERHVDTCEFSVGQISSKCSACGYEASWYECECYEDGTCVFDGNFCPNCGRRVTE